MGSNGASWKGNGCGAGCGAGTEIDSLSRLWLRRYSIDMQIGSGLVRQQLRRDRSGRPASSHYRQRQCGPASCPKMWAIWQRDMQFWYPPVLKDLPLTRHKLEHYSPHLGLPSQLQPNNIVPWAHRAMEWAVWNWWDSREVLQVTTSQVGQEH